MRRPLLFFLLSLLTAFSCRRPASMEYFVSGSEGPYVFTLDLGDTTAVYDFDFYTRLDGRHKDRAAEREMPLTLTWTAPSGKLYVETVYVPLTGGKESFYSRQLRVPYRSGVIPSEAGVWVIRASLPLSVPGLRGLGLVVRRNPWDTEN